MPPVNRDQLSAKEVRFNLKLNDRDFHARFLQRFDKDTTCVMCGQSVDSRMVAVHAAAHDQVAAELKALAAELVPQQEAFRRFELEHAAWQQAHDDAGRRAFRDREQLQAWPAPTGEVSEAELEADRRNIAQWDGLHAEVQRRLDEGRRQQLSLAALWGAVESSRNAVAELEGGLGPDRSAGLPASAAALASHKAAENRSAVLAGQLTVMEAQAEALRSDLDRLLCEEQGLAGLRRWKDMLERGRTLLHHDNLPRLVAGSRLAGINAGLVRYLETFQAGFTAAIDRELNVVCRFGVHGGKPAARLSGGQRVTLGIAFRFAVYDLFARNLGFMVLDEPTAWLDKDGIGCVVELLRTVRSYSRSAGLQLIVVTHHEELAEAADRIIRF
jgi:DNA repair exonuclease SbcCD ATPase subunit